MRPSTSSDEAKWGKRNGFILRFFLTGSTGGTGFFSQFPEETIKIESIHFYFSTYKTLDLEL
jgi:hypothetical protein